MRVSNFILMMAVAASSLAQAPWTMDQCMHYAAQHASSVAKAQWEVSIANADKDEALASFFPSVSAQVGTQVSWGRNIDPETNTYNDVTTFNNAYGIYLSLSVFDGGQTYNRFRRARNERERSSNAVEMQRDDKAIAAMMAFADAVYYKNSVSIASDKLEQSRAVLHFVEMQEELGMKGLPDVVQARATVADDNYNLVHQQNLYSQSMLKLRSVMNFPSSESLDVDTTADVVTLLFNQDDTESIYAYASKFNPKARDAALLVKSSEYDYKIAKGYMMPSISLNGGVSTSYFKNLTGDYYTQRYGDQFRNNLGEYISATLTIPIFSGLSRVSGKRRAKYQLEIAREQFSEQQRQLHDDIAAAVDDRNGYAMEIQSLRAKLQADAETFRLNRKKYEEGLLSLIDLQLSANTYFSSRVTLLQKQMLYILKDKLVEYYKGFKIWM